MKQSNLKSVLMALVVFLTACNNASLIPTATATLVPSPIPTLTATIPPSPVPTCPPVHGQPEVTFPYDRKALQKLIPDYLNEGGAPQDLAERINAAATNPRENIKLEFYPVDISGDGLDELVALAELRGVNYPEHVTAVWVYNCFSGKYQEAGYLAGGVYSWNPEVLFIEDLNADSIPEVIVHSTWGGSGCLEEYYVIGWDGSKAINYLDLNDVFTCKTELSLQDSDGDKQKELVFTGKTEPDRWGAIPPRDFIYTYKIRDMVGYHQTSKLYLPSPYRLYVLADAESAVRRHNQRQALLLYEKAANDATLLDVPSYPYAYGEITKEKSYPKEYATAFALFRMVTLYASSNRHGDDDLRNRALNDLTQQFPKGKPGSEFVEIANLFLSKVNEGKSFSDACAYVSKWIDDTYPSLHNQLNWGAALDYDSGTLCPF